MMADLIIVGGGLAGSEAAWQAAEGGLSVELWEMRLGGVSTGAHHSDRLAELVCSNSLGSKLPDRATGVLLTELRTMGSMLAAVAEATAVPAGGALAVDRQAFAVRVTERIGAHPRIKLVGQEARSIPQGLTILASGPLTSAALAAELEQLTGAENLYFFDALAPIVAFESINMEIAFRASRYDRGETPEGDYLNCPLDKTQYEAFIDALLAAERVGLRSFEQAILGGVKAGPHHFFEGCLPIEVIAERGRDSLAYGPMRPVGLTDPRSGRRPYAVVQLRQDNLSAELFNLVGFQTNLTYAEQRRVLRMIPGLEQAQFERYGQMHRNTFLNAPRLLRPTLQHRARENLFFAGQITGVEGYLGNVATGLLAGLNAVRLAQGAPLLVMPPETMLGALLRYVTEAEAATFQPMKANFGIVPPLAEVGKRGKRDRARAYAQRSAVRMAEFWPLGGQSGRRAAEKDHFEADSQ